MLFVIQNIHLTNKLTKNISFICHVSLFQTRKLKTFALRKIHIWRNNTQTEKNEEKKIMTCSGDFIEKKKKNYEWEIERNEEEQQEEENWGNDVEVMNTEVACTNNKYNDIKTNEKNNINVDDNISVSDEYKFLFERPKHFAHIDDEPIIRRPGCIIDIKTLLRNNWSFPAVGFNSKLEIPIYKFEADEKDDNIKYISVPNDIFGLPIRSDILHKCYYFYRTALAGYTERMQLYKWEWPGSTKKYRSQKKSGKARMNWRKTCGRYLGVKNHPIRPFDQKTNINRKFLWKGMKILLSAKFAQDQIKVVDNFLIKSHKTKYTVKYLRNILGKNCNSALLVHEGKTDVNDNFLWACANIASVKRENVEGVNIYNLLKYRYVVFTYKALKNIIYELKIYPYKMKWLPTFATPNNTQAPIPEKVKNWNFLWLEKRKRNNFSKFDKETLKKRIQEWKWSSDIKGALKVKKHDPYKNFILTKFQCNDSVPEYIKYEYLFNVEDDAHEDNDYEEHFHMLDEILNDDEDLAGISSLSSLRTGLEKDDNVQSEQHDADDMYNDESDKEESENDVNEDELGNIDFEDTND
ncbi:mitochondrial ribosomal protein L4 precursor, putative [Plasmodium sp. gorilla clade G3]|nr:mitochondrial ribosomal protein L4 precursor, putative [Plasmodium sp. gorilla clade G3]